MRTTSLWGVAAKWRVGLVTGSCHSLFFSLGLPFCFSSYIVHLRCTSLTRPLILSLCGVVRERLLPCRVVTAKWVVSCTRITCIKPLSRCSLTLLASFLLRKCYCCFLSLLPFFFTMRSFFFIFFIGHFVPAC